MPASSPACRRSGSALIAGVVCCFAVGLKTKAGYDDALDVVGVHFVGGLVGSLLIGFFADPEFFGGDVTWPALFYGGGLQLFGEQALANGVTIVCSFIVTTIIVLVLKATIGIRVSDEDEETGLDLAEHAETAYHHRQLDDGATHPIGGLGEAHHRNRQAVQARRRADRAQERRRRRHDGVRGPGASDARVGTPRCTAAPSTGRCSSRR